jgi:hypothetical protein
MKFLIFHSILNLDILSDRSNAERYAVNVACTTTPADVRADLERTLSGQAADPNAPVMLSISSITRVPFEQIPLIAQKGTAECRAKNTRDPITKAILPVVTVYFTCAGGEGRLLGSVFVTCLVQEWHIEYMASKPKGMYKSSVYGESELEVNMETLLFGINNHIALDKDNQLRLRAYPNKTTSA